jgi:hypothetical protein
VIRLLLPLAGAVAFFILGFATVRLVKPRQPRQFFLGYAALLLIAMVWTYIQIWPIARVDDAVGVVACGLLQIVLCLTMWNTFYSVLWGFSGGLCHDLWTDPSLRRVDRLVRSYAGDGEVDRMLARRLPNLEAGGYLAVGAGVLTLQPKGRWIARGTLAAFRFFSLGMGGGIK